MSSESRPTPEGLLLLPSGILILVSLQLKIKKKIHQSGSTVYLISVTQLYTIKAKNRHILKTNRHESKIDCLNQWYCVTLLLYHTGISDCSSCAGHRAYQCEISLRPLNTRQIRSHTVNGAQVPPPRASPVFHHAFLSRRRQSPLFLAMAENPSLQLTPQIKSKHFRHSSPDNTIRFHLTSDDNNIQSTRQLTQRSRKGCKV